MYDQNQFQNAQRPIGATLGVGTLGPEISVRKTPPISMTIEQLEKELYGLQEVIHQLGQRLSPVLRPMPESIGKEQIGMAGGSALCGQLDAYCRMLRQASADVHCMIDCLEI